MKTKSFSFELELIPWECYLLVVVGGGMKHIREAVKKHHFVNELLDEIKKDPPTKDSEAYIWDAVEAREMVIWFEEMPIVKKGKKWVFSENFLRLISHEVDHVYYTVARICGFVDEPEANAYSRAWLYGRIKEKLTATINARAKRTENKK